jgi:predicted nucleic acid-binding protein
MRILVDTSILIRLRDADSPDHSPCVEALHRLQDDENREGCLCAQVWIEYWSVATRPPGVNGLGLDPPDAEADLEDFTQAFFLLPEPPDMAARWRALANRYGVRGRQAHDARLVALMLAHGITCILTLNTADFTRYTEITSLLPADV